MARGCVRGLGRRLAERICLTCVRACASQEAAHSLPYRPRPAEDAQVMQALANEKLRLLSQQIEKVDRWAEEKAERKSTETTEQSDGTAAETMEGSRTRVLSRVLDVADAESAMRQTAAIGGAGSFTERRRSAEGSPRS